MTGAENVHAPFDGDQVASLRACQRSGEVEPLVCPSPMCGAILTVSAEGLECPSPLCEYAQEWAPAPMADWSWRERSARGQGDPGAAG